MSFQIQLSKITQELYLVRREYFFLRVKSRFNEFRKNHLFSVFTKRIANLERELVVLKGSVKRGRVI